MSTPIPTPSDTRTELLDRYARSLIPVFGTPQLVLERGAGPWVWDTEGKRYLDLVGGIAVNALGHGHPHLVKAIADQAATLMHVSNLYGSPQGEALAQRIIDVSFADTVFFTNSGAEAVECAIKTARRYHHAKGNPHKNVLITFSNAFHGRTLLTMTMTTPRVLRTPSALAAAAGPRQTARTCGSPTPTLMCLLSSALATTTTIVT